jgi:GTPase SAR1 family protein
MTPDRAESRRELALSHPPHGGFFVSTQKFAMRPNVSLGGFKVDSSTLQHPVQQTERVPPDYVSRAAVDFQLLLGQAIKETANLGTEFAAENDRLVSLRTRLEEGRFFLAALGQFKRGKSTLLNSFLGCALLPTSVVPLTAIPTFIEYGPEINVRVRLQDAERVKEFGAKSLEEAVKILEEHVTEEGNPKNRLGVAQVEILYPASLLEHGVVLIDTPGIGSTFTHNTEATLNFLPQCDAALFVVSSDPPLTEVEAEFLKAVKDRVSRLFFIFNKIDYLNDQEKDAALAFFKKTLKEKIGATENYPIFCVSARRALEAKLSGDSRRWEASGLGEVENHLVRFLASEKAAALREALGRKVRDVLEEVMMRLRLAQRSLEMPLEDLESRLEIFERELKNGERRRIAVQDLLTGDRKRALERLEQEAEDLRRKSTEHLSAVVEASFSAMKDGDVSEAAVLDALAEEVTAFFHTSAEEASRKLGAHVTETLRPHQQSADELIQVIRKTAAELFDIPYSAPESSEAYEMKRRPYWVLRKRVPTLPIVIPEEAIDKVLPTALRVSRLKKRLARQIETLVRHNVENLRWATLQNLNDAFRRFGLTLDQRFQETIAATHGAMRAAREKRTTRSAAIAEEVAKIQAALAIFEGIVAELRK